jgi:hypothetical protein
VRADNAARGDGPCLQPVVVQIDNGYDDVPAASKPSRPKELVAPLTGSLAAGTQAAATARQSLATVASRLADSSGCRTGRVPVPDLPTYLRVAPQAHPGIQAPLGWSLSSASRDDMKQQLASTRNQCSLLVLRYWMTGTSGGHGCIAGTAYYKGTARSAMSPGVPRVPVPNAPVEIAPCGRRPRCTVHTDAFGGYVARVAGDATAARVMLGSSEACALGDPGAACHARGNETLVYARDFPMAGAPPARPAPPSSAWAFVAGVAALALAAALFLALQRYDEGNRP